MSDLKLYRTETGAVVECDGEHFILANDWDALVNRDNLREYLLARMSDDTKTADAPKVIAPVKSQEVWAAGVTYYRSRTARMEESKDAGGGSFYDRVYEAVRPELFFKAPAWRVRANGETIRIRRDSMWNVPEPELALYVNPHGKIIGYTVGNDVSSRDIEGENPLYLPQAKTYDGSCALGPGVLITDAPPGPDTSIAISIVRSNGTVFSGETTLAQMRRQPEELVEFLYRETSFPDGCVLLTGTGIVPPDEFTLQRGDRVDITIGRIGTLRNTVE